MLIKCPECGKEVSDRAPACIHCGYPLDTTTDNTATDVAQENATIINGKSIDLATILQYWSAGDKLQAVILLREQAGMTAKEALDYLNELSAAPKKITTTQPPVKRTEPTKRCTKCGAVYPASDAVCPSCGKDAFTMMSDGSAPRNECTVKCPTCGFTDVERITATAKVTNIALFGLFGNKRKMQFKCKSCGYMW